METYNLGKIELLRDPENDLKGIFPSFSQGKMRGFALVYGRDKDGIEPALDNLGFRLPTIKECVYLYYFLEGIKKFEYRSFWVKIDTGPQVLLIGAHGHDFSIWENAPKTIPYILFAVRDLK